MKTFFREKYCEECGEKYDPVSEKCPKCGRKNEAFNLNYWGMVTPLEPWRELTLFLVGSIGFQIIGILLTLLVARFEIDEATTNAIVNFGAYGLLALTLGLLIWNHWPRIGRLFKDGRTYLGFAMAIALLAWNLFYSMILNTIGIRPNDNQEAVDSIITLYPLLSILIFGLIGPICEEITYRLGLFNVLKRWHIAAAYVLVPIVFGLIHFNFEAGFQFGTDECLVEWLNLPNYVVSGLILCVTYDRFGLGASSIAHISNNMFAILLSLLATQFS